jgi:hypothetical protein
MGVVKWILIFLVCLFVVGLVSYFAGWAMRRAARTKNRAAATLTCGSSPGARVPIFVSIVAVGDAQVAAALRSIHQAFVAAACPLRVYIGVAEYSDESSQSRNVGERFVATAKSSAIPFELGDHVRVLRAPQREFAGFNVAREQLQRFLYHAETFVAVVGPGCMLAKDWDMSLPAALAFAARKYPTKKIVLSGHPALPTSPGTLGTFLALASGRPTFMGLPFRMPPDEDPPLAVPALAWTGRLSFCEGPLPLAGAAAVDSHADDDVFMTARLMALDWQLMHFVKRVGTMSAADERALKFEQDDQPPSLVQIGQQLPLPASVASALGLLGSKVTHRGRLGLVAGTNSKEELALKVGTTGDVLSMLSRIEVQSRVQSRVQRQPSSGPHNQNRNQNQTQTVPPPS